LYHLEDEKLYNNILGLCHAHCGFLSFNIMIEFECMLFLTESNDFKHTA